LLMAKKTRTMNKAKMMTKENMTKKDKLKMIKVVQGKARMMSMPRSAHFLSGLIVI
jgi:hypothetical protein